MYLRQVPLKNKDKEELTVDGEELDKNKGLTDKEVAEVQDLLEEGFPHWCVCRGRGGRG